VKGQKGKPKVRGHSNSLKESSFPSLHFFLIYDFFLFFYLKRRRCQEKVFETKGQKWEGKNGSQK